MPLSKSTLNTVQWDGLSNLNILDPFIEAVEVTGDPNTAPGGPFGIFLNPTQQADRADNVEYPFQLTIDDSNGFFTTTGIRLTPNLVDTNPVPTINTLSGTVGVTTTSEKIICEYVGNSQWLAYDPLNNTYEINGSGTANTLPLWDTDQTSLVNSEISQDVSGNVSIATGKNLSVTGQILHVGTSSDTANGTTIVEVEKESDLPATLAADTTYVIRGTVNVSTSHTVTNSGSAIIGHDRNKDKILYTGSGTFLTITQQTFLLEDVWLASTNSSSTLIEATDVTGTGFNLGRSQFLSIINCQFRNVIGNVMDVKGFDLVDFNNTTFFYISSPVFGCRFEDVSKLEISSCEFIRWFEESTIPTPANYATCPMIQLLPNNLASFGAVNINGCIIHPQQTQDALFIDPSSTTGFGTIVANAFVTVGLTTGTILAGSTYDDASMLKYDVSANQGLKDSKSYIFGYQSGTDTQGPNTTFTPLSIATFISGQSQRFNALPSGVEYIGSKPLELSFFTNLTVDGVGQNNEQFEFRLTKNGIGITGTEALIELDGGEIGPVTTSTIIDVVQGDILSVDQRSPTNDNFTLANFSIKVTE